MTHQPDLIARVQALVQREQSYADALRRIAGNGDLYAGIHLVEECNLECDWWCVAHARCAAPESCDEAVWDVGDADEVDCLYQTHIHCASGCPTRIALAVLGEE